MQRRYFLAGGALAPRAATLVPAVGAPPSGVDDEFRAMFLDESWVHSRSGVEMAPGPIVKLGPLVTGDTVADRRGVTSHIGCAIIEDQPERYRFFYGGRGEAEPERGICVAESSDGVRWTKPKLGAVRINGTDTNRVRIDGIPADHYPTQPNIFRLADGRWRMYFWLHKQGPQRTLRYIAAESSDLVRWKIINLETPCVRHPVELGDWWWQDGPAWRKQWEGKDAATKDKLLAYKRIRSNAVSHMYALPEGGLELFCVWPLPNPPEKGRHVAHDTVRNMLRVVQRRTSVDGLRWRNPELIVVPDEGDPWDQQFHYLAQHRMRDLRIGFLGHYRVVDQTMDVELVYSHDGRRWKRPMRGAWLPRGPMGSLDSMMVYMPTSLIDRGESWIGLYSAADVGHNGVGPGGRGGLRTIHGIRIPRHRFAGMRTVASLTGRLRTRVFNPTGTKLLLDASIDGALRAELCDTFGRPLDGLKFSESVPVQGDSAAHELRWQTGDAADYIYDPVVLNLEWTDGTVYGVASAGD